MYSGYVFQKDGTPLSGIRVSDGRNVCLSGTDGSFTLSGWEKASLIFCNVLTRCHDDWYLPIDEARESYDFHLDLPEDNPESHCFCHLSDTEIGSRGCGSFLPWLKKTCEEQNAKFLFHGGDISGEVAMVSHKEEMNFNTMGIPVRYSIGNHDFLAGAYGEERYEELYGPIWYSFDIGSVRYAVLAISQGSGGFASGYTFEDQCRWLENDLTCTDGKKTLVVFRHNAFAECPEFVAEFENDSFDFKKNGLIAWIQGHAHTCYANEVHSVLHLCSARPDSGGIDNTPGSVRKVSWDGNRLSTEVLYNLLPMQESYHAAWTTKLAGNIHYSSLLFVGEDLIAATCDDGYPKRCGIYRLSGKDGSVLWFYPTKNSVKGDTVFDGNNVYAQDCQGMLYSINAQSGTLNWETSGSASASTHMRPSLRLRGDILYAGTGMQPTFFNKHDGSVLFMGDRVKKGSGAPAKTLLTDDGKTVIYHAQWLRMIALDAETGETKWDLRTQKDVIGSNGAFWYRTSTPAVYDGKLYAFGYFYGACCDVETGEIFLHKKLGLCTEVCGAPAIDSDTVYLPTGEQGVVALDRETLEEKWRYPVGGAKIFSASYVYGSSMTVEASPQIHNDEIVFAANDGWVYFYDKTKPELHKKIPLAFPTLTAPLIRDGYLYAASFDGTVGKYPISE